MLFLIYINDLDIGVAMLDINRLIRLDFDVVTLKADLNRNPI